MKKDGVVHQGEFVGLSPFVGTHTLGVVRCILGGSEPDWIQGQEPFEGGGVGEIRCRRGTSDLSYSPVLQGERCPDRWG